MTIDPRFIEKAHALTYLISAGCSERVFGRHSDGCTAIARALQDADDKARQSERGISDHLWFYAVSKELGEDDETADKCEQAVLAKRRDAEEVAARRGPGL